MKVLSNLYKGIFLFLLMCAPTFLHAENSLQAIVNETSDVTKKSKKCCKKHRKLTYYLFISDFIQSFIQIPTSNVLVDSSTIDSSYLAGRAPLYDLNNRKVGTCSASFLNMQNAEGIFTDISNYISVDSGLIVTWFTPTRLINLELDSIVHSMVTECIVIASTKVGFNPYYGKKFNMIVSSDSSKIYFQLTEI